jgi:DNA-binding transcriptional LysR family regulator
VGDLNPRQLRFVVTLAETRHFGNAAEREYIAQSAFSHQIKRLEQELGTPLFDRGSNRVSLTPAGERLVVRARQILADIDAAAAEARDVAAGARGTVRIGIFGEGAAELTPLIIAAYRLALPDLSLRFTELSMINQVDALVGREVDLAILRPPISDERLELHSLFAEPRYAALPAQHELSEAESLAVGDLIDEPFAAAARLAPRSWTSFWRCDDVRGGPGRTGAEVSSIAESLFAVAYLQTVDTFPSAATRLFPHPDVVYVPLRDGPYAAVAVAHRAGDRRPVVEAFCGVAQQVTSEHLAVLPDAMEPDAAPAGTPLPT